MDEVVGQIQHAYYALSAGQDIDEAENFLLEFYSHPESFEILVELLFSGIDEPICQHAVVGLGIVIKQHSPLNGDGFTAMLPLLVHPTSAYVRKYIREFVQLCLFGTFVPVAHKFIVSWANSGEEIQVEAALYAATMCMLVQNEPLDFLTNITLPLVNGGLQSANPDVQLSAALHLLNVLPLMAETNPNILDYVAGCLQLFQRLVELRDAIRLREIRQMLCYLFDEGTLFPDPFKLLLFCLEQISNREVPLAIRCEIQILSDVIVTQCTDDIAQSSDVVAAIFCAYIQLAADFFNPGDPPELTIFSAIGVALCEYDHVIDFFLESVLPMPEEDPRYRYAIFTALFYLFSNPDYFADKLAQIAELIRNGLADESQCIRLSAAACLCELASRQSDTFPEIAPTLAEAVVAALSTEPDLVFFEGASAIVRSCSSEILREQLYNAVEPYFGASPEAGFAFVTEIARSASTVVRRHFTNIYTIMKCAGGSAAIYGLAHLLDASPDQFAEFAGEFAESVNEGIENQDQEAVRAYGGLLRHFPLALGGNAPMALVKFLELAGQNPPTPDEDHDSNGEEDGADAVDAAVSLIATGIRMVGMLAETYPEIVFKQIKEILGVIKRQIATADAELAQASAVACGYLLKGLGRLQGPGISKCLEDIVEILAEIAAAETSLAGAAGKALEIVADAIAEGHFESCAKALPSILESIRLLFGFEFIYLDKQYDPEVHDPGQRVLREIMAELKGSAAPSVAPFVPLMEECARHSKKAVMDLALQFFGDLVFWVGADDEIVQEVLEMALDALQRRASGSAFWCIKQLTMRAPGAIEQVVGTVFDLSERCLTCDIKSLSVLAGQDNAVTALAKIAEIMGDTFPYDKFCVLVLSAMPAQVEVEENPDMLEWFEYLVERFEDNFSDELAGVLIRLFSDGIDNMDELYVKPEVVERLRGLLRRLVGILPDFERLCLRICGDDEFKHEAIQQALG
jgi:hypothetical protein